MGPAVWMYLYILDEVTWEDGTIHEWVDESIAYKLEIPLTTVRKQRRKLEDEGYIQTTQKQHCLSVSVVNWHHPADEGDHQGDQIVSPSTVQGDHQGDHQGDQSRSLLHIVSNNHTITLKEEEEDDEPEPEFIPLSVSDPELAVYVGVTGFISMPSGYTKSNDNARATIRALLKTHGGVNRAVEFLRPFWVEYRKRKLPPAQYYWLDWAITGEIPPEYTGKPFYKGKAPVKEVDILDPAVYRDKYLKDDEEVD